MGVQGGGGGEGRKGDELVCVVQRKHIERHPN